VDVTQQFNAFEVPVPLKRAEGKGTRPSAH
jgi:hypothetical protein